MERRYRRVDLRSGSWSAERVTVPMTFTGRFRGRFGVRGVTGSEPVLLPVSSVHTIGCRRALLAVALSRAGVVVGCAVVPPMSVRWFRGAGWILELDADVDPPPPHVRLEVVASS